MSLQQPGLGWKPCLLGFEPYWTAEPKIDVIEKIARQKLGWPQRCSVRVFAQGAFNKLYEIRCENRGFLMRVSLPVDPRCKTVSEVATLELVRQYTEIPAPKVIAFDASNDNELGFEWMLMEKMPGQPLGERWKEMSFATKQTLVKRLALLVAQLFRKKFHLLGNLYHSNRHDADPNPAEELGVQASAQSALSKKFVVSKIVSMEFFWADHIKQDVPRGPFTTSQEWLSARLLFHQNDSQRTLKTSNDEDDLEDARGIAEIVRKLRSCLPLVFGSGPEASPEPSTLLHDDLSRQNILVDEDGNLTAVVDWECVSALPLWKACQLPAFLHGRERNERPVKGNYFVEEDGEVNELYWEHLLEHEQTLLCSTFLEEMQRLESGWVDVYMKSSNRRKADFELAVQNCDIDFCIRDISIWLDKVAQGAEVPDLRKLFRG